MEAIRHIKKILVSLDLTDIDVHVINYASVLSRIFDIEKVFFVHAIQAYDLERKGKKLDDIRRSLTQTIHNEIDDTVKQQFSQRTQTKVITKIEDEDASQGVLEVISQEEVDLTLIGQKYGENREGRYAKKIAANAESDLLFIPEESSDKIQHIFCAVDFSEDSEEAFQKALEMARETDAKLSCYYVHDFHKTYFPAETDQALASIEKKTEKASEKYLAKFELKPSQVDCRFDVNERLTNSAEKIYSEAFDAGADLIVVGTKGQTGSSTSLLGNITQNLMHIDHEIPVMIIKNPEKKKRWSLF
ncbi:universal stress protein [Marinilabilia sp.]|jgi:nucleotide-binding universal stress UspA family protein